MQLSDRELDFRFIPDNPRLEDELKLWTRSTRIRYPITFIAEDFFHGKEKYMLLKPEIERREDAQTSMHFPLLSLSNSRSHSLKEEWRDVVKCRGHLPTVLRRQTILFYVPRQECWEGENDDLLIIVKYTCVSDTHTHTHNVLLYIMTVVLYLFLYILGWSKGLFGFFHKMLWIHLMETPFSITCFP